MNLGFPLPATASAVGKMVVLMLPLALAAPLFSNRDSESSPVTTASVDAFCMDELERLSGGRTAGGDIPLGLEQISQLASQPDDVRTVIESARIETVGQIARDPADPTRWRISLQPVTCCAADARAVSVALEYESDPSQWEPGWYRTVGRIALDSSRLPVFKVESAVPIEPPRRLTIE